MELIPGAKRRGAIPRAKHHGIHRKAADNATSRYLRRIHPLAGAGGFQVAGLKNGT